MFNKRRFKFIIKSLLLSIAISNLSGCAIKSTEKVSTNEVEEKEDKEIKDISTNKDVSSINMDNKIPVETEGDRAGSTTKIYLGSEKPFETGGKKGNVITRYGNHNYGCKTQAEYDEVMRIIDEFVARLSESTIEEDMTWKMYELWLRKQNMEDISEDLDGTYTAFSQSNNAYVELDKKAYYDAFLSRTKNLKSGLKGAINQEEFETAVKITVILSIFKTNYMNSTTDPKDGSPDSAYDTLFRGLSDCDADAHTAMALLDRMGFNTAMIADYENEHGWGDVKLGKYWWGFDTFSPTAKKIADFEVEGSKLSVHVEPTYDIPNS